MGVPSRSDELVNGEEANRTAAEGACTRLSTRGTANRKPKPKPNKKNKVAQEEVESGDERLMKMRFAALGRLGHHIELLWSNFFRF